MCGFVCYHFKEDEDHTTHYKRFDKISYRGPDQTCRQTWGNVHFTFHRLAIVDLTVAAMQPMVSDDYNNMLICNGEIYNHRHLREKYGFKVNSQSDCEIILHMYNRFGIERTLQELDGVFAFCLLDTAQNKIFAARDPFGVRPAFMGHTGDYETLCVASEIKVMSDFCEKIVPLNPGSYYEWEIEGSRRPVEKVFYKKNYSTLEMLEEEATLRIKDLLTQAVRKRLMSDREIGCLLSGGLDSSLIAALVAQDLNSKVKTFSIGFPGSPDVEYAQKVAEHIGSDHHVVTATPKEFLSAIRTVIYNIESYDTTTVRASVGNYLVSKYIKDNTDVKVVFNGDGSDEVCMGYLYNQKAPDSYQFFEENVRLLKEIHYFDVLRSDRSISSNGLEARTPFLDKSFVNFNMSIPPEMKMFGEDRPEKYLLRKAFAHTGLLPDEILWRTKCAFSDAVSSRENSWHKIIQLYIDEVVSDEEFESAQASISHCQPALKESYFYRKIFEELFGSEHAGVIPHFWMPKWTNAIDPSARELDNYSES
jgi:asparagine synthase (glutamine-hydrolysing)